MVRYSYADVFNRLLRRYAPPPLTGRSQVTMLDVSAIHPHHSLFRDRYIGSSPKLGEVARSDGGVC